VTSPYIVTTKRRCPGCDGTRCDGQGYRPLSRRAVATLEEADTRVREILVEHGERAGVAPPLPEKGATLSPLPDGTVIEVEQVPWRHLAAEAGYSLLTMDRIKRGYFDAPTKPQILDAYNARQV
jgi:hypothetical protein